MQVRFSGASTFYSRSPEAICREIQVLDQAHNATLVLNVKPQSATQHQALVLYGKDLYLFLKQQLGIELSDLVPKKEATRVVKKALNRHFDEAFVNSLFNFVNGLIQADRIEWESHDLDDAKD